MRENFPLFLLSENQEELVNQLNLTEEEHELLGLEILYCEEPNPKMFASRPLKDLPFEYVKKHGSFKVMQIHENLMQKLGGYRKFITQFSIQNPDKCFRLEDATDDEILMLTKHMNSSVLYNLNGSVMQYEVIMNAILVMQRMEHIENKKMPVFITQIINDGTGRSCWQPIGDGEKYAYRNNIGFNLIQNPQEEPFIIADMYKPYFDIEIVENDTQEYVQLKEKYEKDLAFYKEHTDMLNRPPMPPAFMGTIYVVMNERGKQLYNWYMEKGKEMNLFQQEQGVSIVG